MEVLEERVLKISPHKPLFIPARGWRLCYLFTWTIEVGEVLGLPKWPSQKHPVRHAGWERKPHSFLDIDRYRRPNGFLDHEVCRNPSYTNISLHHRLHHHPSRMKAVLVIWVHRGREKPPWWIGPLSGKMGTARGICTVPIIHLPIEKPTSADVLPDDTQTR
jgi:hypothetical protein